MKTIKSFIALKLGTKGSKVAPIVKLMLGNPPICSGILVFGEIFHDFPSFPLLHLIFERPDSSFNWQIKNQAHKEEQTGPVTQEEQRSYEM